MQVVRYEQSKDVRINCTFGIRTHATGRERTTHMEHPTASDPAIRYCIVLSASRAFYKMYVLKTIMSFSSSVRALLQNQNVEMCIRMKKNGSGSHWGYQTHILTLQIEVDVGGELMTPGMRTKSGLYSESNEANERMEAIAVCGRDGYTYVEVVMWLCGAGRTLRWERTGVPGPLFADITHIGGLCARGRDAGHKRGHKIQYNSATRIRHSHI